MTRLKNPYKLKVGDSVLAELMLHTASYNPMLFKRYRYRTNALLVKETIERELSRFTCERAPTNYRTVPWLLGGTLAILCFIWRCQSRKLRDDLHEPGREIVYASPLSIFARLVRVFFCSYISVGSLLFIDRSSKKETRLPGFQTAKWKKEYLIARRMRIFQKRRLTHFDFLDLGNQDLYSLPN